MNGIINKRDMNMMKYFLSLSLFVTGAIMSMKRIHVNPRKYYPYENRDKFNIIFLISKIDRLKVFIIFW